MRHWNREICVCLDIATTGDDPQYNEILELSAVVLDANLEIDQRVIPFNILVKPSGAYAISEGLNLSEEKLQALCSFGLDEGSACSMFESWLDKLPYKSTKFGTQKKAILLGYHLHPQMAFLRQWLPFEVYEGYFAPDVRDLKSCALFMNDVRAMSLERVPFSKTTLRWIARQYKIAANGNVQRGTLESVKMIADTYRAMCWHSTIY